MRVKCDGCGNWHAVSPTAMAIIIQSFQHGDLQQVTHEGVLPLCLGNAFTPDTVDEWRSKLDSKTVVSFDHSRWAKMEASNGKAA